MILEKIFCGVWNLVSKEKITHLYICNKDVLTRFNLNPLKMYMNGYGVEFTRIDNCYFVKIIIHDTMNNFDVEVKFFSENIKKLGIGGIEKIKGRIAYIVDSSICYAK